MITASTVKQIENTCLINTLKNQINSIKSAKREDYISGLINGAWLADAINDQQRADLINQLNKKIAELIHKICE